MRAGQLITLHAPWTLRIPIWIELRRRTALLVPTIHSKFKRDLRKCSWDSVRRYLEDARDNAPDDDSIVAGHQIDVTWVWNFSGKFDWFVRFAVHVDFGKVVIFQLEILMSMMVINELSKLLTI